MNNFRQNIKVTLGLYNKKIFQSSQSKTVVLVIFLLAYKKSWVNALTDL